MEEIYILGGDIRRIINILKNTQTLGEEDIANFLRSIENYSVRIDKNMKSAVTWKRREHITVNLKQALKISKELDVLSELFQEVQKREVELGEENRKIIIPIKEHIIDKMKYSEFVVGTVKKILNKKLSIKL